MTGRKLGTKTPILSSRPHFEGFFKFIFMWFVVVVFIYRFSSNCTRIILMVLRSSSLAEIETLIAIMLPPLPHPTT